MHPSAMRNAGAYSMKHAAHNYIQHDINVPLTKIDFIQYDDILQILQKVSCDCNMLGDKKKTIKKQNLFF